jgi:hypothetical protein
MRYSESPAKAMLTPMKNKRAILIITLTAGLLIAPEASVAATPDQALHDWQIRRLMQPMPSELQSERSGSVYIYDGLTEREVDAALDAKLDANFERIQYMMFMGTIKTDAIGQPLQDETSGQPVQESGGCSN